VLSILIPVFNYDCNELIFDLHKQCVECKAEFEIVVMDDASDEKYKNALSKLGLLSNFRIIYKEKNLGRNKIRHALADEAKFDYLLFSDCDNEIIENDFVKKYIDSIKNNAVIIGGRVYSDEKPERRKILHWTYGKKREQKSAAERNRFPYQSFMTNNFLIRKNIFLDLENQADISGYGHEDTLMGIQLQMQNISVNHIDNPLLHAGLEDADVFLEKSKNAILNLQRLYQSTYKKQLEESVKLVRYYSFLKKYKMLLGIKSVDVFKKNILNNLTSSKPSLQLFDVLKLYWFAEDQIFVH
jgi:glycosyltransferase involved in cell wall biosynthesis